MTVATAHSPGLWRRGMWSSFALLLLLPAFAMQLTDEVNWGPGDFLVMGAMLVATGLLVELAVRHLPGLRARALAFGAILAGFLLLWAELAVGLFD